MSTSTRTEQRDNSNWLTIQFRRVLSSPREDISKKKKEKEKREEKHHLKKKGREKKKSWKRWFGKEQSPRQLWRRETLWPSAGSKTRHSFYATGTQLEQEKRGREKVAIAVDSNFFFFWMDPLVRETVGRRRLLLLGSIDSIRGIGMENERFSLTCHPTRKRRYRSLMILLYAHGWVPVIRTRERTRPAPSGETPVRMLHCPGRKVMKSASVCVTLDLLLILRFTWFKAIPAESFFYVSILLWLRCEWLYMGLDSAVSQRVVLWPSKGSGTRVTLPLRTRCVWLLLYSIQWGNEPHSFFYKKKKKWKKKMSFCPPLLSI